MHTFKVTRHTLSILLLTSALLALLLSACQPASPASELPTQLPSATVLPTLQATATSAPVQPTATTAVLSGDISLDLSGVAKDQTVETIAAVPPDSGSPSWEAAPQYRRITLQGYPVSAHLMDPQIFVYPLSELATYNQNAAQQATDLQALLQSQQAGDRLPFLPLYNAMQVMHAQVQYLDFVNGKGVRYLTQFDQAPLPINNYELIYTFQGLTADGNYYVAAVFPVTNPGLPDTQQVSTEQVSELSDFPAYLSSTASWLSQQPGDSFTPDLVSLDALVQSIEIK